MPCLVLHRIAFAVVLKVRGLRLADPIANQISASESTQCGVEDHKPDTEFTPGVPKLDLRVILHLC